MAFRKKEVVKQPVVVVETPKEPVVLDINNPDHGNLTHEELLGLQQERRPERVFFLLWYNVNIQAEKSLPKGMSEYQGKSTLLETKTK